MKKSVHAKAVDALQAALRPWLKARGFRVKGRTFNRTTEDGLTQVVSIQMGASDPPGTTYIAGLRENLHGQFTVNLGVYVPEVARMHGGGGANAWVQEYHCSVRARLTEAPEAEKGIWWRAVADDAVLGDVRRLLETAGMPFLERYSTRDKILAMWSERTDNMGAGSPPRIVTAIILAGRGERDRARKLLSLQAREALNPGHPAYVRQLADQLAVGQSDG